MHYSFQASVRVRKSEKAPAKRYFITLPNDIADTIRAYADTLPRVWFKFVNMEAMIGYLKRDTSIFPDKKSGSYLLCIKKNIRQELQIEEWTQVHITLTIKDSTKQ